MIELRKFTKQGIQSFETYLRLLSNLNTLDPPNLNEEPYSNNVELFDSVSIDDNKTFLTRMEIGRYLFEQLNNAGIGREKIIVENPGLWVDVWSWLAFIWLKQFVHIDNGIFNVPVTSRFIASHEWNRFYRHFVATPYYIYSLHGEKNSKLFLECAPSVHNEFMEQLASRQWLITSKPLVELAHILYWDREGNKPKRGAGGKNAGTARRLGKIINQFRLTYDLQNMNVEEILNILPSEFNEWR